jgi:hypothetical protein
MHKSATKCNETLSKWCKNNHGASKIMDTLETYHVALSKKPELGGAVISICVESQYLEFSMATSVQGWRKKWFYIKDRKVSSSDQYGIAPFDASKEVKKLTSWDSPPTEAEMEEIKSLLARIQ